MLGRLMKHEIKATGRLLLPLYLILLCITILNRIILRLDMGFGVYQIVSGILTFTYFLSVISIILVTFIVMITRFYKNLLTDEGYLMFTLPVKAHQLINSKLFVTLFWTFISMIGIVGSVYFVYATPERLDLFMTAFQEGMAELTANYEGQMVLFIIEFILLIIVSILSNILLIYVSIAIGQLFNGKKLIGAFLAYIGIYTALQIVMLMVIGILAAFHFITPDAIMYLPKIIMPFIIILMVIFNILFYGVTNYIFKKKLNLD